MCVSVCVCSTMYMYCFTDHKRFVSIIPIEIFRCKKLTICILISRAIRSPIHFTQLDCIRFMENVDMLQSNEKCFTITQRFGNVISYLFIRWKTKSAGRWKSISWLMEKQVWNLCWPNDLPESKYLYVMCYTECTNIQYTHRWLNRQNWFRMWDRGLYAGPRILIRARPNDIVWIHWIFVVYTNSSHFFATFSEKGIVENDIFLDWFLGMKIQPNRLWYSG